MPEFKTIRQTAATKIVSESYLRQLVAQGKCPGFRIGNRFMVNVAGQDCLTLDVGIHHHNDGGIIVQFPDNDREGIQPRQSRRVVPPVAGDNLVPAVRVRAHDEGIGDPDLFDALHGLCHSLIVQHFERMALKRVQFRNSDLLYLFCNCLRPDLRLDLGLAIFASGHACHVASAIYAECEYFISTDMRLVKYKTDRIKMVTPIEFVTETEDE